MFKKLIYALPVFLFLLVLAPANCYAYTYDYNGTYYLQLPDGTRLMASSGTSDGNHKMYVMPVSNGVRIGYISGSIVHLVESDGSGSNWSTPDSISVAGSTFKYKEFNFPFTLGGKTYTNLSDFENTCSGSSVMRIYETTEDLNNATNFFRNPLLEEMEIQQKGTVEVTRILASYLSFLVPCGIGLLALLTSLPALKRGLSTFLR